MPNCASLFLAIAAQSTVEFSNRKRLRLRVAIRLETQKDFGRIRALPFCYVCGQTFAAGEVPNRDHVPPTGIFTKDDRQPPLILRSHEKCNGDQSAHDQVIAQLVGLLHGREASAKDRKLDVRPHVTESGATTAVLRGHDLDAVIRRWVRGFHAALYKGPLPESKYFSTNSPFPEATQEGDGIRPEPIPPALSRYVDTIKQNRATGNLDGIVCRNGKCRYECVWTRADNCGPWLCIYCLDLYNWIELGDINNFEARGCAGAYLLPDGGVPRFASTSTRLVFEVPNRSPHNPFAE